MITTIRIFIYVSSILAPAHSLHILPLEPLEIIGSRELGTQGLEGFVFVVLLISQALSLLER